MLAGFKLQADPVKKDSLQQIITNLNGKGLSLTLEFTGGKAHSHAVIAIWAEDMEGNYIQTLYLSKTIATGYFEHGSKGEGRWLPGEIRRPASLPFWAHKRGVKESDGQYMPTKDHPLPDAYTGATPMGDFKLSTKTDEAMKGKIRICMEINQAFDFNECWTNNKYPGDEQYMTSGQPSVIYSVVIDTDDPAMEYYMNPIGHGHYNGSDGKLYTNLMTLTTALKIVKAVKVKVVSDK